MKILIYVLAINCFLSGSCKDSNESVFILPEGYQGVVVVFHEIENGEPVLEEKGDLTYQIPKSGVLFVRNSFCETCSMISYYYGNKHSKNKIEYSWGKGLRRKKPMVYGGSTGIYNSNDKSYKCTVFIVGTKQNEDSLTRVKDHLDMDKIFEENR